jgi:hypothetical protein
LAPISLGNYVFANTLHADILNELNLPNGLTLVYDHGENAYWSYPTMDQLLGIRKARDSRYMSKNELISTASLALVYDLFTPSNTTSKEVVEQSDQ